MNVGTELESPCPNCASTTHTVTSLLPGTSATVMCNGCGCTRRYVPALESAPAPLIVAGGSKPPPKRAKKVPTPWAPEVSLVKAVLSRPVRPYQVADGYQIGDRVEHSTFGLGIVDEILGPTKMQVFFPSGHRKMMQRSP